MKKILVSLALAAAVLNGTLASAGSASLSASELQVDGVEALADPESELNKGYIIHEYLSWYPSGWVRWWKCEAEYNTTIRECIPGESLGHYNLNTGVLTLD